MEQMIREAVGQTLNVGADDIQDTDNLIEFGLHSLAIMQLVETFSQRLNKKFKYTDFALSPTIAGWVALLQGE
ncbi:MAG: acyl carrier protein [Neisseriaceae bacterium]|nr:acyl carrier protein [Neisseriaceae bacterium]